ncbi:putative hydrolase of the HAD superfamily [Flavobacteriaceae bacterium MAR_2010_188]|nr:putative hydrolase of the HAD superfamily [Flavobacteriaceae bacterium MAR_2010_188]
MIKTLIFDFGNVFINLDKDGARINALNLFKIDEFTDWMIETNENYEKGLIPTDDFITYYMDKYPKITEYGILDSWNYIIEDFPEKRLRFIKQLAKEHNYKLILLSNTNHLHIEWIKYKMRSFEEFYDCFDRFYLSHEIGMRKPDLEIYRTVLDRDQLVAEECLFIDDTKENTDAAETLGIHTWNLNPGSEDVTELFDKKQNLF